MPTIADIWEKMKEHNIISGIIIFDIISFVSYLLDPLYLVYPGDLDFIFGAIVGAIFTLRNIDRRSNNIEYYKTGIRVGFFGGFASGLSATLFFYPVYIIPKFGAGLVTFISIFIPNIVAAIIIGVIMGLIFGFYYLRKENKKKELK